MSDPRIALLLNALSRAFEGKSWHGPTLKGSIRGVDFKRAGKKHGGVNTIRDLVYHCAYWKYCARQWLLEAAGTEPGPKFPRSPANFPDKGEKVTEKIWGADKRMLTDQHKRLVAAVEALPPEVLEREGGNSGMTYAELIQGVAAHDLYHAGQISLLKRL